MQTATVKHLWLVPVFIWMIGACTSPSPPANDNQTNALPLPTSINVPPTFTPSESNPFPTAEPVPTARTLPSPIPNTPIPFDDIVVSIRLEIPALAYDRLLEGNIGGEIEVRDLQADTTLRLERQAVILIELQQALDDFALEPLPDGCTSCPLLEVQLPLDQIGYSGWLQDQVLLASLQNYFAVTLGPHFPPQTAVGLRRSASPYTPAQSLALLEDGSLLIWQENLERPVQFFTAEPELLSAVSFILDTEFQSQYAAVCDGVPIETMLLDFPQTEPQWIGIACPAYALPIDLVPLYAQLDALMNASIQGALPIPETGLPLTALLQYQPEPPTKLTIQSNGIVTVLAATGELITSTITLDDYEALTRPFFEEEIVKLGLTTFSDSSDHDTHLLIRGAEGVYDASWPQSSGVTELEAINALVETLLANESLTNDALEDESATPAPEADATLEPTATP